MTNSNKVMLKEVLSSDYWAYHEKTWIVQALLQIHYLDKSHGTHVLTYFSKMYIIIWAEILVHNSLTYM